MGRPAQTDAQMLVFRNVSPGDYAARSFSLQGSRYIASVNVGGQEAIGKEVKLGPGIPVKIVFASGSPTLSGTVDLSSGDSSEGAAVLLFPPAGAELEPVRSVIAGVGGSFAFTGLRPDTYSVVAVRTNSVSSLSSGELRALRQRATSVRVDAASAESVRLTIQQ
jgi:hypothetical protein